MRTSEIRDRLLEQRALYQQSLRVAEEEAENFRNAMKEITDEQKEEMQRILGAQYFDVSAMDLERIKEDESYLNQCQEKLDKMINGLHEYLEEELSV